ncbi:MAG: hypothetical protein H0U21_06050 [Acidimicrobiia bacterium]|nr:hypothetical protein [Acidimicrobiia bacterium]
MRIFVSTVLTGPEGQMISGRHADDTLSEGVRLIGGLSRGQDGRYELTGGELIVDDDESSVHVLRRASCWTERELVLAREVEGFSAAELLERLEEEVQQVPNSTEPSLPAPTTAPVPTTTN